MQAGYCGDNRSVVVVVVVRRCEQPVEPWSAAQPVAEQPAVAVRLVAVEQPAAQLVVGFENVGCFVENYSCYFQQKNQFADLRGPVLKLTIVYFVQLLGLCLSKYDCLASGS